MAAPPRPTAMLAEAGDGRIGRQWLGFRGRGRTRETTKAKSSWGIRSSGGGGAGPVGSDAGEGRWRLGKAAARRRHGGTCVRACRVNERVRGVGSVCF
jgi:hypothetical protein